MLTSSLYVNTLIVPLMLGVLGAIIGSFLNALIYRIPRGISIFKGRSKCNECQQTIPFYQNIPILSFLFLRGKCGQCKKPISIRYFFVEVITMCLFVAIFYRHQELNLILIARDLPIITIFVAISFIDLEHRIIPDIFSWGGMVFALITAFLPGQLPWLNYWIGAGVGFGFFYLMAWGYYKVTGKMGLGGGDIKLIGFIGAFLGLHGVVYTILLSSIFGLFVGLIYGIYEKQKGNIGSSENVMKVAIPYGPFLVCGALIFYFFREWIYAYL